MVPSCRLHCHSSPPSILIALGCSRPLLNWELLGDRGCLCSLLLEHGGHWMNENHFCWLGGAQIGFWWQNGREGYVQIGCVKVFAQNGSPEGLKFRSLPRWHLFEENFFPSYTSDEKSTHHPHFDLLIYAKVTFTSYTVTSVCGGVSFHVWSVSVITVGFSGFCA